MRLIVLFFSIQITFFAFSQEIPEQVNSIFWEVSGKDLSKPSYLFGTHHLYAYDFIKKNTSIHQALQNADAVVGEIIINENDLGMMIKLTNAMLMKDQTLDKLMNSQDLEATDKCLRELLGINVMYLKNLKPISLYHLIMVGRYMKNHKKETLPQQMGNSMDIYFQQKARELKKEVQGLETVDDQLKILYDGYPLERQVELLKEMVYDKDSLSTKEVVELTHLYEKQDLSGLFELMNQNAKPEELKLLLDQRNLKWMPQIETQLIKGRSIFVAVGAGHLPGENGILSQLHKRGYTLKPVKIVVQ